MHIITSYIQVFSFLAATCVSPLREDLALYALTSLSASFLLFLFIVAVLIGGNDFLHWLQIIS